MTGSTLLHKACSGGHITSVALLLQHTADADVQDKEGGKPRLNLKHLTFIMHGNGAIGCIKSSGLQISSARSNRRTRECVRNVSSQCRMFMLGICRWAAISVVAKVLLVVDPSI